VGVLVYDQAQFDADGLLMPFVISDPVASGGAGDSQTRQEMIRALAWLREPGHAKALFFNRHTGAILDKGRSLQYAARETP
jgi:hypothetical protein